MGILNSFKNQLGRDSGKVVSNLVFGDNMQRLLEERSQEKK